MNASTSELNYIPFRIEVFYSVKDELYIARFVDDHSVYPKGGLSTFGKTCWEALREMALVVEAVAG